MFDWFATHQSHLLSGFIQATEDCGLIDFNFVGKQFTWERSCGSREWVEERLDKAFGTRRWLERLNQSRVLHLPRENSDHIPIFLELRRFIPITRDQRFRFENCWTREEECFEVIKSSWEGNIGRSLQLKLKKYGDDLDTWGWKLSHKLRRRINSQKEIIARTKERRDRNSIRRLHEAKVELNHLLKCEEDFWRQRAKIFWL